MTQRKFCSIEGCPEPVAGRGMCRSHYGKWWYRQNRERRLETNRRYYERNREAVKGRTKVNHRSRRANPEYRVLERKRNKQKYHAEPEKPRKKARDWYRANAETQAPLAAQRMRRRIAQRFGLTLEEMEAILARGCAICGTDGSEFSRSLHLDHDHTTGEVRDALCHRCNTGLGLFKDDVERLQSAIDYLKTHQLGGDAE